MCYTKKKAEKKSTALWLLLCGNHHYLIAHVPLSLCSTHFFFCTNLSQFSIKEKKTKREEEEEEEENKNLVIYHQNSLD